MTVKITYSVPHSNRRLTQPLVLFLTPFEFVEEQMNEINFTFVNSVPYTDVSEFYEVQYDEETLKENLANATLINNIDFKYQII